MSVKNSSEQVRGPQTCYLASEDKGGGGLTKKKDRHVETVAEEEVVS